MQQKVFRDESTEDARRIWAFVEKAASRAAPRRKTPDQEPTDTTTDDASISSYPFTIRPLSDCNGFMIEYPDLPGCISDGETPEEALRNGRDAVRAYLRSCASAGDPFPKPDATSGQWRPRVPQSLHAHLVAKARQEGVSLNSLVTALIAEGLGRRTS